MKIKLHDPHPGFGGAIIALPKQIKALVDQLNGQEIDLSDCLDRFREEAKQIPCKTIIESCDREFIRMQLEQSDGFIHSWRLLRYKKCSS